MNSDELYEIRKKLASWKTMPPMTLIHLLNQITQNQLLPEEVAKSKIIKTIKTLSQVTKFDEISPLYDKQVFQQAVKKASEVYKKLKALLASDKPSSENNLQKFDSSKELKRQQSVTSTQSVVTLPTIDLFENYKEEQSSYIIRKPFLTGLSRQFIYNLQNHRDQMNESPELKKEELQKIADVITGLEREIYYSNRQKSNSKSNYESDIKTIAQFLKRDKNGSVSLKLYSGALSIPQAAQLKSSDWIDDETRQVQIKIQQEQLEKQSIGFYKQLQKREMMAVEGKQCKGCHQNTVYLVAEKQTRCSDEPTTKFFECFNCGDKFRF